MSKPIHELSEDSRQILIRDGFLKAARWAVPSPNVLELMSRAVKQGFDIALTGSPDRRGNLTVEAVVSVPDGSWRAERDNPGVALAEALAEAIQATRPTRPRQSRFGGEA